eukprot:scaffold14233_cov239-Skeletonema_dohrnii-CCMP3373.AAC.2
MTRGGGWRISSFEFLQSIPPKYQILENRYTSRLRRSSWYNTYLSIFALAWMAWSARPVSYGLS